MAKVNIFNGVISGKLGQMVLVNGKNGVYVRSLPKANDRKSEAQLKQRGKMQQANAFLKPLKEFLKVGFVERKPTQNPYQAATSALMRGAFVENELDYSRARVCEGSVCPPVKNSVSLSDHVAIFRWDDNSGDLDAHSTDHAVILLYNPETETALWEIKKETRKDQYCLHLIEAQYIGNFHVYMAFVNRRKDRISNSNYLGVIEIQKTITEEEFETS